MLTIDIWMYQNRASSCCVEARLILDCTDPAPAPCRGFTGDCAELPAQFADVFPNPFEGYVRTPQRLPPSAALPQAGACGRVLLLREQQRATAPSDKSSAALGTCT